MLQKDSLVPIERLVFVCKNLDQHFQNEQWKNYTVSPVRKIRNYLLSRYIIFKNLMLEFLELIDIAEGHNFAFFEEWKNSDRPLWVGIGLKVDDLESTLLSYIKNQKSILERFVSENSEYAKGFTHKSTLLSYIKNQKSILERFVSENSEYAKGFTHKSTLMNFKIQNRSIYFTEYDNQFEHSRNQRLFGSNKERNRLPSVEILPVNLVTLEKIESLLNIDDHNRVCLNINDYSTGDYYFETDWIVLSSSQNNCTNI